MYDVLLARLECQDFAAARGQVREGFFATHRGWDHFESLTNARLHRVRLNHAPDSVPFLLKVRQVAVLVRLHLRFRPHQVGLLGRPGHSSLFGLFSHVNRQ